MEPDFTADVTLPNGVIAPTDVYLPAAALTEGVLLVRTPYGRRSPVIGPSHHSDLLEELVQRGVAVVVQDCRGTGDATGVFNPVRTEAADGLAALQWVEAQPWSTGRVVMTGDSYLGFTQYAAAASRHTTLVGIMPMNTTADMYGTWVYSPGGVFSVENSDRYAHMVALHGKGPKPGSIQPADSRTLLNPRARARTLAPAVPWYRDWLSHPVRDSYWADVDFRESSSAPGVSSLHIGGWFDFFSDATTSQFAAMAEKSSASHRLVIGPWTHVDLSGVFPGDPFGQAASANSIGLTTRRVVHTLAALKGEGLPGPPVTYFRMGDNSWITAEHWPPSRATTVLFPRADGSLDVAPTHNRGVSIARLPADAVVPTRGGRLLTPGDTWTTAGPADQTEVHRRSDVLTFTTPPLKKGVEVTGPLALRLRVSTDGPDADVAATVSDVAPDGSARLLVEGIGRLSTRSGGERADVVHADEAYDLSIDLSVTSNLFTAGHRIRLAIAASNFPRWEVNDAVIPGQSLMIDLEGTELILPALEIDA